MVLAPLPNQHILTSSKKHEASIRDHAERGRTLQGSSNGNKRLSKHFSGWRAGLLYAIVANSVVLLLNISFLIGASASHDGSLGAFALQKGSCAESKRLNTWLHLLVNVLSTGLVGSGNYCRWRSDRNMVELRLTNGRCNILGMQRLSAPTRTEVDRAHRKGKWVDIGVPSFRNLFFIHRWRAVGWLLLAGSSIPVHLIYNSTCFVETTAISYNAYVVHPAFLNGGKIAYSPLCLQYMKRSTSTDYNGCSRP